jgi:hypothetical protein
MALIGKTKVSGCFEDEDENEEDFYAGCGVII